MAQITASHFINRELSWLRFNTRVLEEASNPRNPPLEQLKYIAIYGTNLDEFYMIRVAGLKEMKKAGLNPYSPDGLSVYDQIRAIREYISNELPAVEQRISEIFATLSKENMLLTEYSKLTTDQKQKADDYFNTHLFPVVIPIAVDSTHPFPHLNNLSFAMVVKLKEPDFDSFRYGLIRLPRIVPRFIEIDEQTFVPIESIVYHHIGNLFAGFEPISHTSFRVTRNADMTIEEEEADDFLEVLEESLRLRKKGEIVRLEVMSHTDSDLLSFLTKHLNVSRGDTYIRTTPMNLSGYWQLVNHKRFANLLLKTEPHKVLLPFDNLEPIMSVVEKQDVALFLPYESFSPVERLIKEAANDPNVLAIRMTLYRVGSNSAIVRSLIEAAEAGKMVTAVVELKARFDEENNLKWARALESAGAHVIYGVVGLKVHAKIAHIIRRESDDTLRHYVHLSTGNYNPVAARVYTDISFFTSDSEIGEDAVKFFHHITGFAKNTKLNSLAMAPTQIKPLIKELIKGEINKGKDGEIIIKVNALIDKGLITQLYKASQAGVKISLIVRGICSIKPAIKGISENIRVVSIVGKYLEHARVFYFKNAKTKLYFSSADWMPRNLRRRIELMTPIKDSEISNALHKTLLLQLSDTKQARELTSDGSYRRLDKSGFDSQEVMDEILSSKFDESNIYTQIARRIDKKLKIENA